MVVVEKCIKKAGLLSRARTFRLELHPEGLYILCLGKATGEFTDVRLTTFEKMVAKKALNYFGKRYDEEHQHAFEELLLFGPREFAKKKNSHFIPAKEIDRYFSFDKDAGVIELSDPLCKMKLYPKTPDDYIQMQRLAADID